MHGKTARTVQGRGGASHSDPYPRDRCPCGSGKKYKACCLTKDEAAERQQLAAAQAGRDARAAAKRLEVRQFKAEIAARLQMAEEADVYDDELDAASNAVVDLVKAGKLDEAKAAAPRPDNSESPHVVGSRAISVLRTGASPETRGTAQKNAASQSGFMDQSVRSSWQLYPASSPARTAAFVGPTGLIPYNLDRADGLQYSFIVLLSPPFLVLSVAAPVAERSAGNGRRDRSLRDRGGRTARGGRHCRWQSGQPVGQPAPDR